MQPDEGQAPAAVASSTTSPPPCPTRRSEKEVENSTLAMLQAFRTARSVPGKELLRLIDEHSLACEEYGQVLPEVCSRVSKLTATLRADLRGSGFKEQVPMDTGTSGVFSEFLSSLGVATPDAVQTSAPQAVFAAPTEPAENAAYLGTLLDDLEHGPAKALQEPSTKGPTVGPIACFTTVRSESSKLPGFLLVGRPFGPFSHCTGCNFRLLREAGRRLDGELKEMVKVLEQLRAAWPELRTSVEGAFEAQKHLRTKDLAQALKQVLQFRRHVAAAIPSIEALCEWLEDATEQVRQKEEERLRFKAMTREVLDGQSKVLAARVAAVLWLKRSRGSSIRPEQTRFDIEQASEALERNLEAAKDMENRLVKGAGTVMKREACHQVVQRTVARLSVLRGKVLSAAEAVAAARADLAGARRGGQAALTEAAARALEQLMAAFDEAASHVDAGGGRGARGDAEDDSPARDEAPSSPSVAIVEAMRSVSQKDVLQDLTKGIVSMTSKLV
ncbi:unnamed protein product [Durusdinium trenchii]|uniref:Uncharacterized protein n=1 Tax=Durusdinium trenchii TaxID=1381693 RepID=A0ABP0LCR1_9DINO